VKGSRSSSGRRTSKATYQRRTTLNPSHRVQLENLVATLELDSLPHWDIADFQADFYPALPLVSSAGVPNHPLSVFALPIPFGKANGHATFGWSVLRVAQQNAEPLVTTIRNDPRNDGSVAGANLDNFLAWRGFQKSLQVTPLGFVDSLRKQGGDVAAIVGGDRCNCEEVPPPV
jgi:hypothetical protein